MSWQLWVLIAASAFGLTAALVVKLRHAQQVFDRIVGPVDDTGADEVASQRRRHARTHQLGHAGLARRHH